MPVSAVLWLQMHLLSYSHKVYCLRVYQLYYSCITAAVLKEYNIPTNCKASNKLMNYDNYKKG